MQRHLFDDLEPSAPYHQDLEALRAELRGFADFGTPTRVQPGAGGLETFRNEFWTRRQRAASSLHEVSYRACFKPQLPRFFVQRLTRPGELVYDPFMGRGTTPLEAAVLGRTAAGGDVNPLSAILVEPRLAPPRQTEIERRLSEIDLAVEADAPADLLVFYHPETLREIAALRHYLLRRRDRGDLDGVDRWIRMVATNRLTGHSPGFFSVYTLPPNQAVSVESQRKINRKRGQTPPRRDVKALILRKSRSLLSDVDARLRRTLARAAPRLLTGPAAATPQLASDSVSLVVTSPPFLDVVQYATDNWLRCWFCAIDPDAVPISIHRRLEDWQQTMTGVFRELFRVLRPGGYVAFEVGEVRRGKVELERAVLPCGEAAGLVPRLVLINDQQFTKTANCWGIDNNAKGTNTNRIVLLQKPAGAGGELSAGGGS